MESPSSHWGDYLGQVETVYTHHNQHAAKKGQPLRAVWIHKRKDLTSKALSRVFSNITVQKHQFFSAQLSL